MNKTGDKMVLIITAQKPQLDSEIDPQFGRSNWLIKIDMKTSHWEALANPGANQSGGAGVAAAQFVIDQKVNTVISGDFGPNASSALRAAKIEMRLFSNETSTVEQAARNYLQDCLTEFK
jgi:predicted Fe-Mo cluster-binding NifX family protein